MSENNNENQNFLEVINDILKTPIERKNGKTTSLRTLLLGTIGGIFGILTIGELIYSIDMAYSDKYNECANKEEFINSLRDKLVELADSTSRAQESFLWNIKIHPEGDPLWMLKSFEFK